MIDYSILDDLKNYTRISIIGPRASGKTTISTYLSNKHNLKHISLDKLSVDNHGNKIKENIFLQKLEEKIKAEKWIVDGYYPNTMKMILSKADCLVWLDYPYHRIIRNAFKKTIIPPSKRAKQKIKNNEKISINQVCKEILNIIRTPIWATKIYLKRRKQIVETLKENNTSKLNIIKIK